MIWTRQTLAAHPSITCEGTIFIGDGFPMPFPAFLPSSFKHCKGSFLSQVFSGVSIYAQCRQSVFLGQYPRSRGLGFICGQGLHWILTILFCSGIRLAFSLVSRSCFVISAENVELSSDYQLLVFYSEKVSNLDRSNDVSRVRSSDGKTDYCRPHHRTTGGLVFLRLQAT